MDRLYCWGYIAWITNGGATYFPPSSPYAVPITTDGVTPLSGVLQVDVSSSHACAVVQGASSKEVWCWGQNLRGALGLGDNVTHRYPTKVMGLANPTKVVSNGLTTCALEGSGGVRCWGRNDQGADRNRDEGVYRVPAPTSVVTMGGSAIAGIVDLHGGEVDGYGVYCGLTTGNTLQCWG